MQATITERIKQFMSRRKHKKNKNWQKQFVKDIKDTKPYATTPNKSISAEYPYNHWFKNCEHKITPIFTLGIDEQSTITFCGATKDQVKIWTLNESDLILNVSGYSLLSATTNLVKGPAIFDSLKTLLPVTTTHELLLQWSDGASFPGTVEFWQKFYDICQEQHYKRVIACCLGGHGRTGTALGAILIANSRMTDLATIAFIQEHYCSEAIETWSQKDYLEKLYFELHPEEQLVRQEQEAKRSLTSAPVGDKIIIDLTTDMVVDQKPEIVERENSEYRSCVWCAQQYLADKADKDDLTCSDECEYSLQEFQGYDARY